MRYSGLPVILAIIMLLTSFNAYAEKGEYRVDTGDVLLITVYDQPDLTTKARVTSKGIISFPLVGDVNVEGMTIDEIAKRLEMLLGKDYLVNPQVNVLIEDYRENKVFVMGFVNKPGEFELSRERPTTVLEAITMAGGFKEGAAANGTKIIRVENGKEITIPVKVNDITVKGEKEKDVQLRPGDIIVVPESFF